MQELKSRNTTIKECPNKKRNESVSNHLKASSKEVNADDELPCASSNECDSPLPIKVNYEIDSSSRSSLYEVSSSDLSDECKSISSIEEK